MMSQNERFCPEQKRTGRNAGQAQLAASAAVVCEKAGSASFDLAVILGSGLGEFTDKIEDPVVIPYEDLPCLPPSTVAGHAGRLVAGTLCGRRVLTFQGRFHMYEGYSAWQVAATVRLAHYLKSHRLLLTNAVGGISERFRPGDFMFIEDHLNFLGDNPLRAMDGNPFVDLCHLYEMRLLDPLLQAAESENIRLFSGVFAALMGPSYETPSEVRALKLLGADAVSMSTVPEAIMGKYLHMEVAGLSLVANYAAGLSTAKLTHEDVLSVGYAASPQFSYLLECLTELWCAS